MDDKQDKIMKRNYQTPQAEPVAVYDQALVCQSLDSQGGTNDSFTDNPEVDL